MTDLEMDPHQRPRSISPTPLPSFIMAASTSTPAGVVATGTGTGLPPRSPLTKHKRLAPSSSNNASGSFGPLASSPLPLSPSSSATAAIPLSLEDRARASMRDDHQRRWATAVAYRTQCAGGLWPPYGPGPGPLVVGISATQCRSCHIGLGDASRLSQHIQRLGLCELCEHNIRYAELHEMTMMGLKDLQDENKRLQMENKRLQEQYEALQRHTDLFGNTSIAAAGAAHLRIDTNHDIHAPSSSSAAISSSAPSAHALSMAPTPSSSTSTLPVPPTPVGSSVPPSPMPQIVPVVLW